MDVGLFIGGSFFFAVGVAIWIGGTRDRTGFPLVGTVVDHKRQKSGKFHISGTVWVYYPIIEYTSPISGERERLKSGTPFDEAFEIGAPVELRYNQERKEVRFPTRSTRWGAVIFMGIGLAFVAISLDGAWKAIG